VRTGHIDHVIYQGSSAGLFHNTNDKKKNVKKNARPYEIYYGDKKSESEIENVIEINENIAHENSFEINEYYADKIGKYCRNCNSIFDLKNKLYQYLRNSKISDNIRRIIKIKIRSTVIIPDKNIFILKFFQNFLLRDNQDLIK
jgi:hypothetical protein